MTCMFTNTEQCYIHLLLNSFNQHPYIFKSRVPPWIIWSVQEAWLGSSIKIPMIDKDWFWSVDPYQYELERPIRTVSATTLSLLKDHLFRVSLSALCCCLCVPGSHCCYIQHIITKPERKPSVWSLQTEFTKSAFFTPPIHICYWAFEF